VNVADSSELAGVDEAAETVEAVDFKVTTWYRRTASGESTPIPPLQAASVRSEQA
jgi:hypothetical protein